MNREIKFRAWDKSLNSFITDDNMPILSGDGGHYFLEFGDCETIKFMQFTGLLDKQGLTEVYEGDIIGENGLVKGNIYEINEMDKRETDTVVPSITSEEWNSAYKSFMDRGLRYS